MFFSRKQEPEKTPAAEPVLKPVNQETVAEPVVKETVIKKKERVAMEYEVLISKNTVINGNINIKGFTRIDGVVDGTIAVDSDLFIGETGNIKASIYAQNAVVAGTVTGNVSCKGRLELTSKAKLIGDIKCGTLVIAEGAVFRGRSSGFENDDNYVEEQYAQETAQEE